MIPATQKILCPFCRVPNPGTAKFCQNCGRDVLLNNDGPNTDQRLYRIVKVIKEGGMGIVYKAIDDSLSEYAIKEMHDRFANDAERRDGIERFQEEAELLAKLRHPAVPRVYSSFLDEGRYYLAMEFIYGEDLEDRLVREHHFDEATVLRWADQICDVLEYMHAEHLIYRDMKPGNIMITNQGDVKLIDFGIAKLLLPGQRGTMIGTPGYAPPEQYQGLASAKSDIYALAATMHHLLTGRDPRDHPPFSFPVAREINPEISPQTSMALEKALSMDETQRFTTITQFRRALPIDTGDRRPTLPFDLPRQQPQPEPVRPQPQPQPQRPVQQQPRPVQPPVQPPLQPVPQPKPVQRQRRRPGFFGRLVRTTMVLGVLGGMGVAAFPQQTIPVIKQFVQQVESLTGGQPAVPTSAPQINPSRPIVQPALELQPYTTDVTITIDASTPDSTRIALLRDAYYEAAKQAVPGAQKAQSVQPSIVGDIEPTDLGNGQVQLKATMNGQIAVPTK